MKILVIKDIENCFDGTFIKEIYFTSEMDKHFIEFLCMMADSKQYFGDFGRPFFKAEYDNRFSLKGVEGEKSLRAIFKNDIEKSVQSFRDLITVYKL